MWIHWVLSIFYYSWFRILCQFLLYSKVHMCVCVCVCVCTYLRWWEEEMGISVKGILAVKSAKIGIYVFWWDYIPIIFCCCCFVFWGPCHHPPSHCFFNRKLLAWLKHRSALPRDSGLPFIGPQHPGLREFTVLILVFVSKHYSMPLGIFQYCLFNKCMMLIFWYM